jgi:ribonuclease HI
MSNIFYLYVDGSWKKYKPDIAGWAFVLLNNNHEKIIESSGIVYCVSRQVDGELYATLMGLKAISKSKDISKVYLYYDYAGIEAWANGSWKAKSEVALEYLNRLKKYETLLQKVEFVKIKSHAGLSKWNDYVDSLAKKEVDEFED